MLAWLSENLPTIIICAILLAVVVMIVVSMIRNKKKGKTSCGCGCAHCAASGICHDKQSHQSH